MKLKARKTGSDGFGFHTLKGNLRQTNPPTGEIKLWMMRRLPKSYTMKLVYFKPDEYAAFYGCYYGVQNEYLFIYSRERTLSYEALYMINRGLQQMGVQMVNLDFTDQYNCFHGNKDWTE